MHSESVKSVKYIGKLETVDITVNHKDHIYYGNGIATSNSHAIEYSMVTIACAACKCYYPTEWYTANLIASSDKPDSMEEIAKITNDAKLHGVIVEPPDIRYKNPEFKILEQNKIIFGISNIRGMGLSSIKKLESSSRFDTFNDLLLNIQKIKRSTAEALIKTGACDCYGLPRVKMLRIINALFGRSKPKKKSEDDVTEKEPPQVRPLTDKELPCFYEYLPTGVENISTGVENALNKIIELKKCTTPRIETIRKKIEWLREDLKDTNRTNAIWEKIYLGIPLSCSAADDFDKKENVITCRNALSLHKGDRFSLHVVVDGIKLRKTGEKAKVPGQEFANLIVSDNSCSIELTAWPDTFAKIKENLSEGQVVSAFCRYDVWGDRVNYIIIKLEVLG